MKKKSAKRDANTVKASKSATVRITSEGRLKKMLASGKVKRKALTKESKPISKREETPLLISVSGIRGVIGKGFHPEVISRYAAAFGTWANNGTIVIGRDSRVSGEMVRTSVVAGLMATGCRIVDIGMVATPTAEIAVRDLKAHGGIAITASHNPVEWNALKLIGPKGLFLNESQASDVYDLIRENKIHYVGWDRLGKVEYYDYATQNHIDHILELDYIEPERIREKRIKVVVDCINGAGSVIVPRLLKELNCDVIAINDQPHGIFPRNPEPSAENLATLQEAVLKHQADIGFAVDPDVDRLAVVSEVGSALGEEYTLALATEFILKRNPGPVAVNASTSMVIDAIAKKYNEPVHRTKIGEIHVSMKMKETRAVIGGEGNGGVILPEMHYGRDAVTGIALILQMMTSEDKKISELKKELPAFVMIKKKIEFSGPDTNNIIQKMKKDFKKYRIDETDGVKIMFEDGWVQMRKSNTEPIIRIMGEATDPVKAEKYISLFTSYFQK